MEETGAGIRTPKFAEQVDTLRKRAAFICEDYDFKDGEKFDAALEVRYYSTGCPGYSGRSQDDPAEISADQLGT